MYSHRPLFGLSVEYYNTLYENPHLSAVLGLGPEPPSSRGETSCAPVAVERSCQWRPLQGGRESHSASNYRPYEKAAIHDDTALFRCFLWSLSTSRFDLRNSNTVDK